MRTSPEGFAAEAAAATRRPSLKVALDRTTGLLQSRRTEALSVFPEFQATREAGKAIKEHTLRHLDHYLEEFERNATAHGVHVHWAETSEEACEIVVDICRRHDARSVTRVKSMLGEEIGLPGALEAAGIERVETDLAEHIIQLADEPPSHIVIPAMHKTREEVAELFATRHREPVGEDDAGALVESARRELRPKYVGADVGISGANFLVAETGGVVTVTNEGNAELTTELPRVHIVTAGIEKLVPTLEHATVMLRLLARSALGTEFTQYTTFFHGPRRPGDRDGPEEMHVVLVDAGRTEMLAGEFREMLRCIRCAACINHCPVYGQIGGHPYGSVYPGPMGSVLTPVMQGLERARELPQACTLNGRCAEVCPVGIPLTDLIRRLRERTWREDLADPSYRRGIGLWAFVTKRPRLYRLAASMGVHALRLLARVRGKRSIRHLPLAAGWTKERDFPAPEGGTFMAQYRARRRQGS